MKSPAFQFYPTDYLGSQRVQMMTLEEEGAYIRLLCYCWQHGSIPADPGQVARLIGKGGSTTVATTVLTMFTTSSEPGRMTHERLDHERGKQTAWRDKSSAGGRKSAEIRKSGSTTVARVVQPTHQPNGNTLSSSSSSLDITNVISIDRPDPNILEIYQAYPRRVGKTAALKAIAKAAKNCPDLLAKTTAYAAAVSQWSQNERQYIPHPSTWFNRGSFDDDPETWQRQADTKGRASFA